MADPEHEARWMEYCNMHRCDSQSRGSVYDSKAGQCLACMLWFSADLLTALGSYHSASSPGNALEVVLPPVHGCTPIGAFAAVEVRSAQV